MDDGQVSERSDIDVDDGEMDSLFTESDTDERMNNGCGTCLQAMTRTSAASRATETKAISSDMLRWTFTKKFTVSFT